MAVAVDGRWERTSKSAEARFLREVCGLAFSGAGGDRVCITASGQVLARNYVTCVQQGLQAWDKLPEADRKPGAVKVGELAAGDKEDGVATPPPGGLIVKVYYRPLGRDAQGELRHATPDDFIGEKKLRPGDLHALKKNRVYEAHPDFMWLTESEWKSLVPANPKQGDALPVPAPIARRIYRFHLDVNKNFGDPFVPEVRSGELTLRVEKTSPAEVRLRLDGFAVVKNDVTFEARLLGFLTYDSNRKAFSRFDVVAIGNVSGQFHNGLGHGIFTRPGRSPYGISFELASGASPAERVPPRGQGPRFRSESYFGKDK